MPKTNEMDTGKRAIGKPILWAVLALPAAGMIAGLASGGAQPDSLLHPSGEFAARLMIVALMLTPLRMLFPNIRWLAWLARHRRSLGVGAFAYAALHTVLYIVDMETLRNILAEFWALGIWTGWAAMLIFLPLAATSNDRSTRRLGRSWKTLHQTVYAAAALTLAHWIFVHNNLGPALVHFLPLAALEAYRLQRALRSRGAATSPNPTG